VPLNPKAGFDGIVVRCQVLECESPSQLATSWPAGPIIDTQVIYRLEPDGGGTRVFFEHSGFDMSHPWGEQAFRWATSRVWLGENARSCIQGSVASGTMNGKWGARLLTDFWSAVIS